jgi:predicted outer membrane repeat protein
MSIHLRAYPAAENTSFGEVTISCNESRHLKLLWNNNTMDMSSLQGITFLNGLDDFGGCLLLGGSITVDHCYFENCQATMGGAITVEHNDMAQYVMIQNSTFRNNYAINGGAIYTPVLSTLTIYSSLFWDNRATYGGALYYQSGGLFNCSFMNNSADYGGAICSNVSDTTSMGSLNYCQFSQNRALYGGGLYSDRSTSNWQIINSNFTSNTAQFYGGGLYISPMTNLFTLQNCLIQSNTASNGAGIYLSASPNTMMIAWESNSITSNQAMATQGNFSGGLYLDSTPDVNPGLSLGNLYMSLNTPLNFYCNNTGLFLCREPSPLCRDPTSCGDCKGICVPRNATSNLCYASVAPPVCAHGQCVFSGLPVCTCDGGWSGDLCDVEASSSTPLISLWYFWVGIGGGLLVIVIIGMIVYCRRRADYSQIDKSA